MSGRLKRYVGRPNYRELADVKVLRRTSCTKITRSISLKSSTLYRLKILEHADRRVKVRDIGYSKKYDEWREADDIIDLNASDNWDEETESGAELLLGKRELSKFCLFEELVSQIKFSLVFSRKGDPVCSIVISFDTLHFEALIQRSTSNGGKLEVYGLSSLSKLDLLGEQWYVRGINSAGDFCYIEPGTVKFFLKCQCQKLDFQQQDDGTMET